VTFQEDVSREACSEAEKKLDALLGDFQNTVQMQVPWLENTGGNKYTSNKMR
jgi:hypothetical protein